MNCQLQTQLKNAEEIKSILNKVDVSFVLSGSRKVQTLLVYLPIKDGTIDLAKFFEAIKNGILSNFVFSCSEVEKKLGIKNPNSAEDLFEKAIRKISQHTAKGELGELILFTLLDVYFGAPKILSKVSMKTNPRMPVFGADAVHGQFHDGKLRLYLGESKLYNKFLPAATAATKSISSAVEKYTDEFDLIDSYMDFPDINEDLQAELIKLLDPFSNNDLSELIQSPCFIGFAEPNLISTSSSEDDFIENYKELAAGYIGDFFQKVEKQNMNIEETALLLLPFSSVDKLVAEFIAYIGIE